MPQHVVFTEISMNQVTLLIQPLHQLHTDRSRERQWGGWGQRDGEGGETETGRQRDGEGEGETERDD